MRPDSSSLWESIRATDAERCRINKTLRDGERLLWLGRPKPDLRRLAVLLAAGMAVGWLGRSYPLILVVCFSIVLLEMVRVLAQRFLKVYAVTNRRSIVLTRGLFRFKVKSWDVHDYVSIERGKNGRGSIVYEDDGPSLGVTYLQYGQQGLDRADEELRNPLSYALDGGPIRGLMNLRDVETVAALVKAPASECSAAPNPEDFIEENYIPEREKPMSTLKTVLLGCLFACVGAASIWGTCHFFKTAIGMSFFYLPITGTVTAVEREYGSNTYTPRYSYVVDGRRYETKSIGSFDYGHFKPGAPIDLRYPPDRPQDATVDEPAFFWVVSIFIGVFAILFSLLTISCGYDIFRRSTRRKAKTEA